MSYKYNGANSYEITLKIVVDCLHGSEQTRAEDNPAPFSIFSNGVLLLRDEMQQTASNTIPVETHGCDTQVSACFTEAVFTKIVYLPASNQPYDVVVQRCCRNTEVTNVANPANFGDTYHCKIPALTAQHNNSAVFKSVPLQCVCPGTPLTIDNGATDSDGDSLSYEYAPVYVGAEPKDTKPPALPPPFTGITYSNGLSYNNPMDSPAHMQLDANTGILTATPDVEGIYLIAIACNEWRNGVKINTTVKEYELMTTIAVEDTNFQFSAGPNPVHNILTLTLHSSNNTGTLSVTDMRGHVIKRMSLIPGETTMDLSGWPTGIYFFDYREDKRHSIIRVAKW